MTADERQICPACGTPAQPEARFCEECGTKIDVPTNSPQDQPTPAPQDQPNSESRDQPTSTSAANAPGSQFAPGSQSVPGGPYAPGGQYGAGGQSVPVMQIAKRRSKTPWVLAVIGTGLLALIIGIVIGFAVGWNGYRPAKLSQARATQITSELSSGNANRYADATELPKQAAVTSSTLQTDAKETFSLDASTFHFITNKLGWAKVTVKVPGGSSSLSLGMYFGYVDGKWKMLPNILLGSS